MVRCDERGFPILDLNMVRLAGHCVVRCRTPREARNFLSAMMSQHREKCRFWSFPDNRIELWYDENRTHIDFYPYFDIPEDTMAWDDRDYAELNGYKIIEFSDLPFDEAVEDLGIIVNADESIEDLLA